MTVSLLTHQPQHYQQQQFFQPALEISPRGNHPADYGAFNGSVFNNSYDAIPSSSEQPGSSSMFENPVYDTQRKPENTTFAGSTYEKLSEATSTAVLLPAWDFDAPSASNANNDTPMFGQQLSAGFIPTATTSPQNQSQQNHYQGSQLMDTQQRIPSQSHREQAVAYAQTPSQAVAYDQQLSQAAPASAISAASGGSYGQPFSVVCGGSAGAFTGASSGGSGYSGEQSSSGFYSEYGKTFGSTQDYGNENQGFREQRMPQPQSTPPPSTPQQQQQHYTTQWSGQQQSMVSSPSAVANPSGYPTCGSPSAGNPTGGYTSAAAPMSSSPSHFNTSVGTASFGTGTNTTVPNYNAYATSAPYSRESTSSLSGSTSALLSPPAAMARSNGIVFAASPSTFQPHHPPQNAAPLAVQQPPWAQQQQVQQSSSPPPRAQQPPRPQQLLSLPQVNRSCPNTTSPSSTNWPNTTSPSSTCLPNTTPPGSTAWPNTTSPSSTAWPNTTSPSSSNNTLYGSTGVPPRTVSPHTGGNPFPSASASPSPLCASGSNLWSAVNAQSAAAASSSPVSGSPAGSPAPPPAFAAQFGMGNAFESTQKQAQFAMGNAPLPTTATASTGRAAAAPGAAAAAAEPTPAASAAAAAAAAVVPGGVAAAASGAAAAAEAPAKDPPCAACKSLRRKCTRECLLLPYFPRNQPEKFVVVHKVFGASNVSKMLQDIPMSQREDTVASLEYEAQARLRDPVYGCVGVICLLQKEMASLQEQLKEIEAGSFASTPTANQPSSCAGEAAGFGDETMGVVAAGRWEEQQQEG